MNVRNINFRFEVAYDNISNYPSRICITHDDTYGGEKLKCQVTWGNLETAIFIHDDEMDEDNWRKLGIMVKRKGVQQMFIDIETRNTDPMSADSRVGRCLNAFFDQAKHGTDIQHVIFPIGLSTVSVSSFRQFFQNNRGLQLLELRQLQPTREGSVTLPQAMHLRESLMGIQKLNRIDIVADHYPNHRSFQEVLLAGQQAKKITIRCAHNFQFPLIAEALQHDKNAKWKELKIEIRTVDEDYDAHEAERHIMLGLMMNRTVEKLAYFGQLGIFQGALSAERFTNLLCDTRDGLQSISSSNHYIQEINGPRLRACGMRVGIAQIFPHRHRVSLSCAPLLEINKITDKGMVEKIKIAEYYFSRPFDHLELERCSLGFLIKIMAVKTPSIHSAIYNIIRVMPQIFNFRNATNII